MEIAVFACQGVSADRCKRCVPWLGWVDVDIREAAASTYVIRGVKPRGFQSIVRPYRRTKRNAVENDEWLRREWFGVSAYTSRRRASDRAKQQAQRLLKVWMYVSTYVLTLTVGMRTEL